MRAEKLVNGKVRVEFEASELHVVQFLAMFFLSIPRAITGSKVFTGRFVRRVRRVHDALKEIN